MKKNSPMLFLTFLGIIFILPSVLAWYGYSQHGWIFHKTNNYGELITPPRDLNKLTLYSADGKEFSQQDLRGKWLMLYVSPNHCDEACQKELYYMRQVRLMTGKEMERVQRAIITIKGKTDPKLPQIIQNGYVDTFELQANQQDLQQWLTGLPSAPLAISQGYLYLVDPLGNVMMEYPLNADPNGIFKDLKKLLKISQIG